ncbi:MAG: hypothetical protein OXC08_07490 [Thiotrichales bacterium]|nr:hypothetical protein [Thiotrichales bacterium]
MAFALSNPRILRPVAGATAWLLLGVTGIVGAGWGYGLFFASMLLLAGAAAAFALLVLTRAFDGDRLRGSATWLGLLGMWAYVWAVGALAGHYTLETFEGRMELKWILFGPAVLVALVVLDVGLYRMLVGKNLPAWRRYRGVIRRELANPEAMRRTLVDDVILHRTLLSVSGFRWLKHTLIFWGFALMFAAEMLAVLVREGFPAFGWTDIWEVTSHPVRLAFDFVYDFTGLMVLVGCALAIGWRIAVQGTEERKYTDTPTAVFLFLVALSGFVVEGMRLAAVPWELHGVSFVGSLFAMATPVTTGPGSTAYEVLWLVHVLGSCAFIAYVPVKRLVHSCATPMGRLMHSQRELLAAKKHAVLAGLMMRRP